MSGQHQGPDQPLAWSLRPRSKPGSFLGESWSAWWLEGAASVTGKTSAVPPPQWIKGSPSSVLRARKGRICWELLLTAVLFDHLCSPLRCSPLGEFYEKGKKEAYGICV